MAGRMMPFAKAQGASADERVAHALEYIASRSDEIEQHLEAISRDMLKLTTHIQQKMK